MTKKNVSVIMPVFNEERTLNRVVREVLAQGCVRELIIVNDGSTDRTGEQLTALQPTDSRLNVIHHRQNQGKTAAIRTGLKGVTGEIVIIQDADLEYDPREISFVCEPIWEEKADVVYGSRFLVRKAGRVLYYHHYLANKLINFFSNVLTNKNITDVETCYKAMRSHLLVEMPIVSSGFGFEIEVTANVGKTRARLFETPISYYGRTYEEGKKIKAIDGIYAFLYILRFNLWRSKDVRTYIRKSDARLTEQRHASKEG